jgi:hypothetical protein
MPKDIEAFTLQSSQLSKVLTDFLTDLENSFRQTAEEAIQAVDAAEDNFRLVAERTARLGGYGWTLPMLATSHEPLLIIKLSTDEASADAAFVEFYTGNDAGRRNLQELQQDLLSHNDIKECRPLLEEAIFCLENGKYRSCVASLLPLVEGVLAKNPDWNDKTKRNGLFAAKLQSAPPGSIEHTEWLSVQKFCDGLFACSDFGDAANRPTRLNRHWILHGRNIPSGELSDCLRLLQALGTIIL